MGATGVSLQLSLNAVIFATDFSPCSTNAGHYAALLARQFDADMLICHAFELTQSAMEVEAESSPPGSSEQRKEQEAALRDATERFGDGARCVAPKLLEGDPREKVPELARMLAPSFLVLGTEGRGRIERGLVGSVAEGILRRASAPAITVGPNVPPFEPGCKPFRRILYATGLSPAAARAASYAVSLARASQAELQVLHVIHPEEAEDEKRMQAIRSQFSAIIEEIAPDHAHSIVNPEGFVEVGNAHRQILHHIREFSADLLVLGVRKTSHLWLEARRSSAFQIIAEAPCPVMTVVR
jgi:nucleotide-binding universal stress UspA family protein